DLKVAVDELAQACDLVLGQILHPRVGAHPRRGEDTLAGRLTDAEDIRERNFDAFVAGDIYPGDSGHAPDPPRCLPTSRWPAPAVESAQIDEISPRRVNGSAQIPLAEASGRAVRYVLVLPLTLLVLGVLAANHHDNAIAANNLTTVAARLHRCLYLHPNLPS